jgi:hypothetical protein
MIAEVAAVLATRAIEVRDHCWHVCVCVCACVCYLCV